MDPSLNGHGAVDLAAVKAAAQAHEQLEAQRPALAIQLLTQSGLICRCGAPMSSVPVYYFTAVEGEVQTPAGPQLGVNLVGEACCQPGCPVAVELERTADAKRNGPTGKVTLLGQVLEESRRRAIIQRAS